MKNLVNIFYILTFTILLFTGCGSTTTPSGRPQTDITVAKADADAYEVIPSQEVHLTAKNSTVTNDVTYTWVDINGNLLGNTQNITWTAPAQEGNYTIVLILNYQKSNQSTNAITITVENSILDINDSTFGTIQEMIRRSKNGQLADVTYICVGDSTRAYTVLPENTDYTKLDRYNHSEKIFEDINNSLQNYAVDAYLMSEGGLEFKTFLGGDPYDSNDSREWIKIQDVIALIPGDGNTTIIDISLGVNDLSGLHSLYGFQEDRLRNDIKDMMRTTIYQFRQAKPKVKIMLTSPNPYRDWQSGGRVYQDAYKEIAQEEHLPFANFVDEKMPAFGTDAFLSLYHDNIHFSINGGIKKLSTFLKEKILPPNE